MSEIIKEVIDQYLTEENCESLKDDIAYTAPIKEFIEWLAFKKGWISLLELKHNLSEV